MKKNKKIFIPLVIVFGLVGLLFLLQSTFPDWSVFKQATCMPISCFSEKIRDSGMRQPINAITSLLYIYLGIYIIKEVQ